MNRVFRTFHAEETGFITFEAVLDFMKQHQDEVFGQDIWDVFGRSMLKDFPALRR